MRLLEQLDSGQRAGLIAAAGVVIAAQITLALSLISQQNLEASERINYANAILSSVASRTAGLIASGDMLTATSELNRLISSESVASAAIMDVEGTPLVNVGDPPGTVRFERPLKIGPDLAGSLAITLNSKDTDPALRLTITAMSLVVALFAYGLIVLLTRAYSKRLWLMLERVSQTRNERTHGDPLDALDKALGDLPLDLIDPSRNADIDETSLTSMSVVTVSLDHLARYSETLDDVRLVDYVATFETMLNAIGQMLGGESQANRQHSLSLTFDAEWRGMSPGVRAAVSAALLQHVLAVAERSRRLKFMGGIGIGYSDVARGERRSAYAGLFIQSAFDEALHLAERAGTTIKIALPASEISALEALFDTIETADGDCQLGPPRPEFLPELDKQSRLLQRRLFPDVGEQTDLPF